MNDNQAGHEIKLKAIREVLARLSDGRQPDPTLWQKIRDHWNIDPARGHRVMMSSAMAEECRRLAGPEPEWVFVNENLLGEVAWVTIAISSK